MKIRLKHHFRLALAVAGFSVGMAGPLQAQVPQLISYQGRIAVTGTNFDGTGQFKFALGNGVAGTPVFWSNGNSAVSLTVTKGLYSVLLGDATQPNMAIMPATVFTNSDVRLRVQFNDGVTGFQTLAPDQRIAAVGYALMALTVPSNSITAAQIADGTIGNADINAAAGIADTKLATISTAGKVANSALNASVSLLGSSIESSEITDGTIVNADIAAGAAIADTKLATLTTAGKVANSATTAVSTNAPNTIVTRDAAGKFAAGGIGIGTNTPLASLHIVNNGITPNSTALENDDIIIGALDASLGLYSPNDGTYGSAISLKEIQANGNIVDTWGWVRKTSGSSSDLLLTYGSHDNYAANPVLLTVRTNGVIGIGTSTPTDAILDIEGNARANDFDFFFRGGTDRNHALGWYGAGKTFGGVAVDGPVLYGFSGGALGRVDTGSSTANIALRWTAAGNVGIGTNTPQAKLHVNGEVKLGTNGQYFATAGDENLRVIRGGVTDQGTAFIVTSGYSCSRLSTGVYNIDFADAFADTPVIVAMCFAPPFAAIANVSGITTTNAEIRVWNVSGTLTNRGFNFIAVGPR